jgi:hypothetical protein
MANIKFTEFPSATTLTGTEIIPIVQAGTNKKVTATLLKAFADSGYVPYVGATTDLNLDTHDLYTAKVWLKDVPNDAFGSLELTDGVLHFEDVDGHSMVTMEDGYLTIANASTIRALLDVSALSANRDFAFPNASGTLALTSNLSSYLPLAGGTLTGALQINTSVAGLVLNRPSVTTYTGTSLLTGGTGQWFVGMRENLSSNDYIIYNESGFDNFKLDKGTGAATFSSTLNAKAGSYINGAASSDWGFTVENTGTTAAHGLYVNIGSSSTGIPFRVDKGGSSLFNIANSGAATFSSSVTTGGQILVNTGTVNQNTKIFGDKVSMSRTSDGAEVVYFSKNTDLGATATANIHGYDGIQFRTQGAESVKLTITETGNVGIGTTTPSAPLDVNGSIYSRTGSILSNTFGGYSGGNVSITTNTSGGSSLLFKTSLATRLTIDSGGGATFGSGLGIGGATAGSSGIQFPATQVASASANNLDDYEEGTWTMGVSFGGASVGVTYGSNTGTYTKVGRQVTINGYMSLTNKGSSTGNVFITGLPFTVANSTGFYAPASMWQSAITFVDVLVSYADVNSTTLSFEQSTNLGVTTRITDTNFSNTSAIMFNCTYFV